MNVMIIFNKLCLAKLDLNENLLYFISEICVFNFENFNFSNVKFSYI